jgi:multidrug efflux system membrane fusion protein
MTNTTPTDLKTFPEPRHIPSRHEPLPPGGGKPKKRGLIWVLFLTVIAGIAAYAVYQAGRPVANPQGQGKKGGGRRGGGGNNNNFGPLPVVAAKAHRAAVPVYLNGLGNVTAFYTVTVKSRVDGQLMSVNFKEGDQVKEGQVLAEIDPRPFQVQLEQAQGTFARDTALLQNARLDLERYRVLLAQDAVPKQQLDTQTALVAQYEGNIKQDQAAIDNAKLQLVYAKVTAPISGTVGLRLVDPGNIVHAGDANGMIVITQLQPISCLFTIPEDMLPQVMRKLRAGAHLPVEAWNRDNSKKLADGELLTVDNQIDNTTGTSRLKAVFQNKDFTLFPQQFVNIRLLVDTLQNQIVIPPVAVQTGQQGTFVYKIDEDSTAHLQPVTVGMSDQSGAVISKGLKEGDQVAVDGADRIQDGGQVRIRRPGELDENSDAGPGSGGQNGNFRKGGQNRDFKNGRGQGPNPQDQNRQGAPGGGGGRQ